MSGVDSRERTSPGSPAESCRVLNKEAAIKLSTLNDGLLFPNLVAEGLATTRSESDEREAQRREFDSLMPRLPMADPLLP